MRPSAAVFRRRRAVVAAAIVAVGLGAVLALTTTGGSGPTQRTRVAFPPVPSTPSDPPTAVTVTVPSTTVVTLPVPRTTAVTVPVSDHIGRGTAAQPPVSTTRLSTPHTATPHTATPNTASPNTATPPSPPAAAKPLAGKVIAIDPGHNGGNFAAPGIINQPIWNGRATETCDTTGTQTDAGYTEAQFNFNVAQVLAGDLEAAGARVVLTRDSNAGVGPCVTARAAIGNNAHADVAISIHADGGPPSGRGFAVLEPLSDGVNAAIVGPSQTLAVDVRSAFLAGTAEPVSSYDGVDGIQPRDDLAGLNLSTVPKVLIECANMRNATDAGLLTTPGWQRSAADSLASGLTAFLSNG